MHIDHQQLFDALCEAIVIIDAECRIREVNRTFCEEYHVRREDVIGRHCHEVTHNLAAPCWEEGEDCPVKALAEGVQSHRVVHRHRLPDGTTRWEEIVASRLPDSPDGSTYVVEELRDVTELVNSREVVDELKKKLNLLEGILPVCARCHKIRDDDGSWRQIESYIRDHSEADFSHAICPDCSKALYPELHRDGGTPQGNT